MENDINTLKLIATASAHLKVQGIQSGIVPMPGTDKSIVIGSPAEVVELMPELRGAIPAAWHNFARAIADLPHGAEANIAGMQSKAAQLLAAEDARGKVLPKDEGAVGGTSEQQARYAIDGAIQYGRENRNPPPSTGHWLYEYWNIGQQLRELGKTGWDNVTPAASQPVAASAGIEGLTRYVLDGNSEIVAVKDAHFKCSGEFVYVSDVERLLATQSAKQGAQPDLHNAIMNLRCDVQNCILGGAQAEMAYKMGHRDARHGAAELVGAHEAGEAAPAAPLQTMGDTTREEALEESKEASEILESFINNVSTDGPYSAEATLTFISQAKQCVDGAIRALAGQQVAQGEKGGES